MEILVIGLGAFGSVLAAQLKRLGVTVVGIDNQNSIITRNQSILDDAFEMDATDYSSLQQIGIKSFDYCFVCVGGLEAGLLIINHLETLEAKSIYVKASEDTHESIFKKLGLTHVFCPEKESAERFAQEFVSNFHTVVSLGSNLIIASFQVPSGIVGRPLREVPVRDKFRINIIWLEKKIMQLNREGDEELVETYTEFPSLDYVLSRFDTMGVIGTESNIRNFMDYYGSFENE